MNAVLDWSKFSATSFSSSSEFSPDSTARRRMKVTPSSASTCRSAGRMKASMMAATGPCRAAAVRGCEPAQPLLDQRPAMAAVDLREQALLAVEMVADAGDIDLRGGGELAHRHTVEPALGEQPLGGSQDAVAGAVLLVAATLLRRELGPARFEFAWSSQFMLG